MKRILPEIGNINLAQTDNAFIANLPVTITSSGDNNIAENIVKNNGVYYISSVNIPVAIDYDSELMLFYSNEINNVEEKKITSNGVNVVSIPTESYNNNIVSEAINE